MINMIFEITSHVGAGALRFGMTVSEIRSVLPCTAESFLKAASSEHPTDAFRALGVHVFYGRSGRCEAIEFGAPACPTLSGSPLLGVPFSVVSTRLANVDPALENDESGTTSASLGLAIYCPAHHEDPMKAVEGVLVFVPGYYG